jgi:hypothetical protein
LTFVPPYPGEFLNPFPLGTTIDLFSGYMFAVTVNSATINATAEVEAVTDPHTGLPVNGSPPAGDQFTVVNLSLTNPTDWGQGPSSVPDFLAGIWAEGADRVSYKPESCVPPPLDLGSIGTVDSGQTVTGNLCFTIASTDAGTIELGGTTLGFKGLTFPVWFALR